MGNNGGFNPFRDANGEFTTPAGSGKPGRSRAGGVGAAAAPNRGPRRETYRANPAARAIPILARFQPSPAGRKQTADALSEIAAEDGTARESATRALRGLSPGRARADAKAAKAWK